MPNVFDPDYRAFVRIGTILIAAGLRHDQIDSVRQLILDTIQEGNLHASIPENFSDDFDPFSETQEDLG